MNKERIKPPKGATYEAPEARYSGLAILSAEEFLALLKKRKGDLSNCYYHVTEEVCIGNEFFKFSIHLGYGVFENGLSFKGLQGLTYLSLGNSTINGTLRIEESKIVSLRFGSAKIHGQASLDDMESIDIKFGEARFDEKASFNKILCETIFHLGKAVFKSGLSLEESVVGYIHAGSANLGDLTLVDVYFESFSTDTATASKLTIQGDTDSFREDCINTIWIDKPKGDPSPNSLTTRLALAMKEMEPRYYKLGLPDTIAYFLKKKWRM